MSFAESEPLWGTACNQLLIFVATPGCDGFPSLDSKENCEYRGWERGRVTGVGVQLFLCLSVGNSTVQHLPPILGRHHPCCIIEKPGSGGSDLPEDADKAMEEV